MNVIDLLVLYHFVVLLFLFLLWVLTLTLTILFFTFVMLFLHGTVIIIPFFLINSTILPTRPFLATVSIKYVNRVFWHVGVSFLELEKRKCIVGSVFCFICCLLQQHAKWKMVENVVHVEKRVLF
jgi:hypothetical protein